jgi:hypothetical protein
MEARDMRASAYVGADVQATRRCPCVNLDAKLRYHAFVCVSLHDLAEGPKDMLDADVAAFTGHE